MSDSIRFDDAPDLITSNTGQLLGDAANVIDDDTLELEGDGDHIIGTHTQGAYINAGLGDDALIVESDASGVDISGISRWGALGREIGSTSDYRGFAVHDRGASAEINGQLVTANHHSINSNIASRGADELLSSTALETALQLSTVAVGVETIVATSGNDRFFGYDEDVTVYGGAGNDYFRSTGGQKELYGGEGSDNFYVRGEEGTLIDGGEGHDRASFAGEKSGLVIESIGQWGALGRELGVNSDNVAYSVYKRGSEAEINGESIKAAYNVINRNEHNGEQLADSAVENALNFGHVAVGVEKITASKYDDIVLASRSQDQILAHDGNDFIDSRGGDDYVDGGKGNDNIVLAAGNNTLVGGEGEDMIWLRGGADDFTITENADGSYSITTASGDVSLVEGIENARLSDGSIHALSDLVDTDIPDPVDEPVEDPVDEPVDEDPRPGEDPIEDPVEEPVDEDPAPVEDPEPVEEPVANAEAVNDSAVLNEDGSVTINLLANDSGDGISVSSVSQPSNGQLVNNGDGTVTYRADANYNGEDSFSYTVTGSNGSQSSASVTLTVRSVNDAPVVNVASNVSILENAAAGAAIALVTATDADADSLSYSITGGNENGLFAIDAQTGEITLASGASLDFETATSHTLEVSASDGQAVSTAQTTVNVGNVDEALVITSVETTVVESLPAGSIVADIDAVDPDGEDISYEILSGNDDGLFSIDTETGEISISQGSSLDFELQDQYTLEVAATAGDERAVATAEINVADVDEDRPSADALIAATDRAFGEDNGSGSIGISGTADYSSQLPFLDIFKSSRPVKAHAPGEFGTYDFADLRDEGYLDENGWPTDIPADAGTLGFIFADTIGREGTYVLRYEGEGELNLRYDAEIISRTDHEIVFKHNSGTFEVTVTETDPNNTGDHIRNISIVKEEYVDLHDAGAIFNPDALEVLQDFREFRTLGWQRTIESQIQTIDDLPSLDYSSWATEYGTPLEVLVELSNQAGTDLWITIPTLANDELIDHYATYIRDNLDPNLKITVEFGNELWNNGYRDTHQLRAEAIEVWGVAADDYTAHTHYVAKKATEVALRFNEVFDQVEDGEKPLIHHALGTQSAVPGLTERLLDASTWRELEPDNFVPPADVFDSVAVTTYFGGATITRQELRDDLIEAIEDPNVDAQQFLRDRLFEEDYPLSIPATGVFLREQKEIADRYGVELTDYEGGAHLLHFDNTDLDSETVALLQDFYVGFYRSEHMAELYQAIWDIWREIGSGAFNNLGSVGEPSVYGFFTFLSDLNDTSPRADFLYDQNAGVEAWWEDRGGEHFQQGLIDNGTDGDDLLIGTNQEDFLGGGEGNDYIISGIGNDGIHGGNGTDTALFAGSRDEYDIYRDADGRIIFRHENGQTNVLSVEVIEFQSGEIFAIEELVKDLDADNTALVAVDDVVEVREDIRLTISDLLANDSDADGDTLVITEVSAAEHGIVRLQADGSVLYIPEEDYVGTDSFTYVVSDGIEYRTATVQLNVANELDAPDVVEANRIIFGNEIGEGELVHQVVASDLDGDTLSYSIIGGNESGKFAIDAQSGAITATNGLALENTQISELYNLTVSVTDGRFTTDADITLDVHNGANLIAEAGVAGEVLNGADGDSDILQLVAYDGRGRTTGAIGQFNNDTYDNLLNDRLIDGAEDNIYRIYSSRYRAEIDGEEVAPNNATFSLGFEESLAVSNVAVNFEIVSGTEFFDQLFGTSNDDIFYGNEGSDFISTSRGDDTLVGGAGSDNLFGSRGADTFVFDSLIGVDRLGDFSIEQGDKLDFTAFLGDLDVQNDEVSEYFQLVVGEENLLELQLNVDGDFQAVAVFSRAELDAFTLDDLEDSFIL